MVSRFFNAIKGSTVWMATMVLLVSQMVLPFVNVGVAEAADTGFATPGAAHAPNDWDVNAVANIQTSNNVRVTDNDGSSQGYSNFDFPSFPAGAVIDGIQVRTEASSTDNSGCRLGIELSHNNGSNYTSRKHRNLANNDVSSTLGGTNDTWGRTWSASDFSNVNFVVKVVDVDGRGSCSNSATSRIDILDVKVYYSVPTVPAANPPLSQACGLDIALVIDNSTSISGPEMTSMKSAMTSFTNALAGTPTEFSVTRFASSASVLQTFTGDTAAVNAAINGVPVGGGYTNWEDGLAKAQSTLTNRANPDLVVFASDGDPTTSNTVGGTDTNQPNAHLDPAVAQANAVKALGARVLAIGIGDPSVPRLSAISGPNVNTGNVLTSDVITTDFSTLAADLAIFANQTCGGTVTIQKLIDADGNANTTNDRTPAQGWSFDVNGGTDVQTDVDGLTPAIEVTPDSGIAVNEEMQDGYQLLSASCDGASNNGSQNGNAVIGLTIAGNDIVSCTFVNAEIPGGTIVLEKTVVNDNGGTLVANDFPVAIDGSTAVWGDNSVSPGDYTVSETTQPGYQAGVWGGDCDSDGNVTVASGQTATCTITNDDVAPTLTLEKTVKNDDGGTATEANFQAYIDGNPVDWDTPVEVKAGQEITATESSLSGYAAGDWGADCEANGTITLKLGESATCTITNDDKPATVKVVKYATHDNGGSVKAKDFKLYVDGDPLTVDTSGDTDADNSWAIQEVVEVKAGASHTVSEDVVSGYENTYINCFRGNDPIGHPFTPVVGEQITCNVGNDDIAPKLTVTKIIDNNWGGDLEVSDFDLFVDGLAVTSGVEIELDAGTYTVSELQQMGYKLTGFGGDCDLGGEITLEVGGTYTCDLTNQDRPARIKVRKDVVNDDGGTAVRGDFDLYVNKTEVNHGAWNTFPSGEYTVSESEVNGYEQTDLRCWDLTDPQNRVRIDHPFMAENGRSYDCRITNDDEAPMLQLKKTVRNNNGGDNPATDWTLTAQGTQVTYISESGAPVGPNMAVTESYEVAVGDPIALSETGPAGYKASEWRCNGGNWDNDNLYLSIGDEVTCQIVNNDIPASVKVVKVARNDDGGNMDATDFSLYLNGYSLDGYLTDSGDINPTDTYAEYSLGKLNSNEVYEVTEDSKPGYELESIECFVKTPRGDMPIKHPFTPSEGQRVICKVFNNDKPAKLTLVKKVINDDGGRARQNQWVLYADGPTTVQGRDQTPSLATGVSAKVSAGWYSFSEDGNDGYELTSIRCNGEWLDLDAPRIRIRNGQEMKCVFVNDDIPPTLRLAKTAISIDQPVTQVFRLRANQDGNRFDSPYRVDVNDDTRRPDSAVVDGDDGLDAGWVRISERVPDNWELADIICYPSDWDQHRIDSLELGDNEMMEHRPDGYWVRLRPGEDVTCRFINVEKAKVNVTKYWDVDQNGQMDDGESTLPDWTFSLDRCRYYSTLNGVTDVNGLTLPSRPPIDMGCNFVTNDQVTANEHRLGRYLEEATDENGVAVFEGLSPFGMYVLSEQFQDGWNLSGITCEYPDFKISERLFTPRFDPNRHSVHTIPGAEINCYVGNYQDTRLEITKTNNRIGEDLVDGDTIVYQITVTNPVDSGISYNTVVNDLMPENIIYVNSSGAASSSVRGPLAGVLDGSSDYIADGPASWELGEMQPGEAVTLTYSAIIANDTEPGTYENIAFVEGWGCSYVEGGVLPGPDSLLRTNNQMALIPQPYIDLDDGYYSENSCPSHGVTPVDLSADIQANALVFPGFNFAELVAVLGNQVNGVGDPFVESAVSIVGAAESQGFVLGITTEELVNTGTPAILPPMAGLTIAGAAILMSNAGRKRRGSILVKLVAPAKHLVVTLALVVGFSGNAIAATGSGWQLNVVDLPAATSDSTLEISYQVASTDASDTFGVALWQDGVMIDSAAVTVPLGDNGSFTVADLADGTYEFAVVADSSDDATDKTNTQTVSVDTEKPAAASYEGVEQDGNEFTLTFTVPATSDATTVNVYSAQTKTFNADETTLVGSIAATPGVEQMFTYAAADDSTRYFALELVDAANNASPLVGDEEVVVTTITDTSGSTNDGATGANGFFARTTDVSTAEDGAEVLGEDDEVDDTTDGSDEGSGDGDSDSSRGWIALGAVAVAAGGFYIYQQRSGREV